MPPYDFRQMKITKRGSIPSSFFFPKFGFSLRVLCGGPSAAMVPWPTAWRAQKWLLGRLILCSAPFFLQMAVVVESRRLETLCNRTVCMQRCNHSFVLPVDGANIFLFLVFLQCWLMGVQLPGMRVQTWCLSNIMEVAEGLSYLRATQLLTSDRG